MRHAATTFVTVAFLVLTAALPSRAHDADIERAAAAEDASSDVARSPALHLVAGLVATTVQLSVYGSCLALGGERSSCLEDADLAGRWAVGRARADAA